VPEAVPGDRWQLQRFACRPQGAAEQVFRIERSLFSGSEYKVLEATLPRLSPEDLKRFFDRLAHWNVSPAAPRFRRSESAF